FVVATDLPLRITEINYMPHDANGVAGLGERDVDNDRFEFLEVTNVGGEPIDLEAVRLVETDVGGEGQGVRFVFAAETLDPNERIVVVRDRLAFVSRYGSGVRIALGDDGTGGATGEYGGKLSNAGERLRLVDADGRPIAQLDYGAAGVWPERAHGGGSSLEVIDVRGDYADPNNWRASREFGGSPGSRSVAPDRPLVINEVVVRSEPDQGDQIELFNPTDRPIDVAGWYLSDSGEDYFKVRIATPLVVPAGGYGLLLASQIGFDLGGMAGEQVWLIAADASGRPQRFVDTVRFDASDPGISLGRWPNGDDQSPLLPMASTTFGSANAGPRTGAVIVSEIHYRPELPSSAEPIAAGDFSTGSAIGFEPVVGRWSVEQGGYEATPTEASKGATIATIVTEGALPENFSISATLRTRTTPGFNQNAAIIFDYRDATDFKFVSMHTGGDKWRIGQRDASGWQFLATVEAPIEPDTDTRLTLDVEGATVVLRAENAFLRYEFDTPVTGGQLGVGSKNGAARFDNIAVRRRGDRRDLEFLELLNTTDQPIDLAGWRVRGAVEMTFAQGTRIGAAETLVVVRFDPADTRKATIFRETMGIAESVPLAGPYKGRLNTIGEAIRLTRPAVLDGRDVADLWVDEVAYDDLSPWPTEADGRGAALQRANQDAFGGFASNWSALDPTPGTVHFAQRGDMNFDGLVDQDDVPRFVSAVANTNAYQAAYGDPAKQVADVDGDGDVDFDDIRGFVIGQRPEADRS
ncbi:MAG: hypothetical protein ACC645_18495, partial [Pirellulales bacterium]